MTRILTRTTVGVLAPHQGVGRPRSERAAIGSLRAMNNFCAKYFCEGQKLSKEAAAQLEADDAPWYIKYRKQISIAIPFTLVHIVWWSIMGANDDFGAFTKEVGTEKTPAFYMSITMIFGSMLAGATSEGGESIRTEDRCHDRECVRSYCQVLHEDSSGPPCHSPPLAALIRLTIIHPPTNTHHPPPTTHHSYLDGPFNRRRSGLPHHDPGIWHPTASST